MLWGWGSVSPRLVGKAAAYETVQLNVANRVSLPRGSATNPNDVSVSIQWLLDGVDEVPWWALSVDGAGNSYVSVDPGWIGRQLTAVVTASAMGHVTKQVVVSAGMVTGLSMRSAPVPVVWGTVAVGEYVWVDEAWLAGSWVASVGDPVVDSFEYQWFRVVNRSTVVPIDGATFSGYSPTVDDHGFALFVEVTGRKYGFTPVTVRTRSTAVVLTALNVLVNPEVSGVAGVGETLTVDSGVWEQPGVRFSYQWWRCDANWEVCEPISRATRASYRLVDADYGSYVFAAVWGSLRGWATTETWTNPTNQVAPGFRAVSYTASALFNGCRNYLDPLYLGGCVRSSELGDRNGIEMWTWDGLLAQASVPLPQNTIRWRVIIRDTYNPYRGWPYFDQWAFFQSTRDIYDSDRWTNWAEITDGTFTSEWTDSVDGGRGYFAISSLDFLAVLYFNSVTIEYEFGG